MAKKWISKKKLRKAVRKNPYAAGLTALVALGGVAAAAWRNGQFDALKADIARRLGRERTAA